MKSVVVASLLALAAAAGALSLELLAPFAASGEIRANEVQPRAPAAAPTGAEPVEQRPIRKRGARDRLRDHLAAAHTVRIEPPDGAQPAVGDRTQVEVLLRVLGGEQSIDRHDPGVKCRAGLPLLRFYTSSGDEIGFILLCQNVGLAAGWFRPAGRDGGGRIDVKDPAGLESWLRRHGWR